jgi:1-phosphatidylinositol-4-phosphate 5-kinase
LNKHESSHAARRVSDLVVMSIPEVADANSTGSTNGCWDFFARTFGNSNPEVYFIEIEPFQFRRVRAAQNITDADYIQYVINIDVYSASLLTAVFVRQFKTTIKERVTQGGASGAFFFFSRDELFIAKSCTTEELETIRRNAVAYADYISSSLGRRSFISKIYGAYTLQIYGISLHFFVMNNLFVAAKIKNAETGDIQAMAIHEKYDIKGSTVNRSSAPPTEGQLVTCKNCEQKFIYHHKRRRRKGAGGSSKAAFNPSGSMNSSMNSTDSTSKSVHSVGTLTSESEEDVNPCIFTVSGQHEPNVILKDNDLKYKIRLPRKVALRVVTQLEADANFLFSVGVMDYSLLGK